MGRRGWEWKLLRKKGVEKISKILWMVDKEIKIEREGIINVWFGSGKVWWILIRKIGWRLIVRKEVGKIFRKIEMMLGINGKGNEIKERIIILRKIKNKKDIKRIDDERKEEIEIIELGKVDESDEEIIRRWNKKIVRRKKLKGMRKGLKKKDMWIKIIEIIEGEVKELRSGKEVIKVIIVEEIRNKRELKSVFRNIEKR